MPHKLRVLFIQLKNIVAVKLHPKSITLIKTFLKRIKSFQRITHVSQFSKFLQLEKKYNKVSLKKI